MSDVKAANARTCMDVARELISQPALFSEFAELEGFTSPPAAVQRYTGERSTLDEERMLRAGALRLLGASDREIAAVCHVTRRTIPLLLAELETSSRITPLKQRLALLCGDNAERANIALRVLLDKVDGKSNTVELAAMIKAVGTALGIVTEKFLLTTGQATEIIETRSGAGRDEFEAWWQHAVVPLRATVTPATDFASPETPRFPEQNSVPVPTGHSVDTSTRPETGPPAALDPGPNGGGGGAETPPAGGSPMG